MKRLLLFLPVFVFLFHKPTKAQLVVAKVTVTTTAKPLSSYHNPFTTHINVEFKVNEATEAGIELYNMAGQETDVRSMQSLNQGTYKIRIEPSLQLVQQEYLLKLLFEGG